MEHKFNAVVVMACRYCGADVYREVNKKPKKTQCGECREKGAGVKYARKHEYLIKRTNKKVGKTLADYQRHYYDRVVGEDGTIRFVPTETFY